MNVTPYEEMECHKPTSHTFGSGGANVSLKYHWNCALKVVHDTLKQFLLGMKKICVGWCVRDLNGKYHFSCDVIFNKLVLVTSPSKSPTSSSPFPTPSSSSSPPLYPLCTLNRTTKGQAFVNSIHLQDECLAAQHMKTLHPQQSSSANTGFVSLFATDDILPPNSLVDLSSHEDNAFSSFCLFTAVDHHHFQRPLAQNFDL